MAAFYQKLRSPIFLMQWAGGPQSDSIDAMIQKLERCMKPSPRQEASFVNDNLASMDRDAMIAYLQEQLVEKERLLEAAIAEKNRAGFQSTITGASDQTRSEAAATASGWKWNNWVLRTFPRHYDRIAAKVHGQTSDDPKIAFLERWNGRRVSNETLRADEALMKAIAARRRAKRREQQRQRRQAQRGASQLLPFGTAQAACS